jgi:hypothetical protein
VTTLQQFLYRWWWVGILLVYTAAISSESFWIDEALTGTKAREATWGGWWRRISGEKMSDLQMPFYMASMWGYAKIFGTGEWTLRMMNLPWMVIGVGAFMRSFTQNHQRAAAGVVLTLSPFAWYYLNEARPYAMQLGAALLVFAALRILAAPQSRESERIERCWFGLLCGGLLVLGGCNMLGMIWVAAAGMALVIVRPDVVSLLRRQFGIAVVTMGGLLFLSGYYFWTLQVGARASGAAGTSWVNVVFAGYELTGFAGLGPGRLQLRDAGVPALRPYVGWLLAFTVAWGLVLLVVRPRGENLYQWRSLVLAACMLGPVLFLVVAGFAAHFRLLGRHLTPVAVVLMWLLTLGMARLWAERIWWRRAVVVGFVGLSLASCLSLRFAARHARDDYRTAAARAQSSLRANEVVWWSAALCGAEYYRLPLGLASGAAGQAVEMINPTSERIQSLPPPELVVVSKPDLHDVNGALKEFLTEHKYDQAETLPGFTLWTRSRSGNPKL